MPGPGGPPSGMVGGFGIQNGATYPNNLNTQFGNASSIPGACTYNVSPTLQNNGQLYTCGPSNTYAVTTATPIGAAGAALLGNYPDPSGLTYFRNITDFGIFPNCTTAPSCTDNTSAINSAIAGLPTGVGLHFNCPASYSGEYFASGQVQFKAGHVYQGVSAGVNPGGCKIASNFGTSTDAAFSAYGQGNIAFINMDLSAINSGSPPGAVLGLASTNSTGNGSHVTLRDTVIEGFAAQATAYSIASEDQDWDYTAIINSGGGAIYTYYTSSFDDLGICPSCYGSALSNTDIRHRRIEYQDFTNSTATHYTIGVSGLGSQDISFEHGHALANNSGSGGTSNSYGFLLDQNHGVMVNDVRLENAYGFAKITRTSQNVKITNNTLSTGGISNGTYFINAVAGTSLINAYVTGNNVSGSQTDYWGGCEDAASYIYEPFSNSGQICFNGYAVFAGVGYYGPNFSLSPRGLAGTSTLIATQLGTQLSGTNLYVGTAPTVSVTGSGCALGTASGTQISGTIPVTMGGTCTVTLTWASSFAFSNHSFCGPLQDITQNTIVTETSNTTTSVTFHSLSMTTGDTLQYGTCSGN